MSHPLPPASPEAPRVPPLEALGAFLLTLAEQTSDPQQVSQLHDWCQALAKVEETLALLNEMHDALAAEVQETHTLLDEVAVGKAHWSLTGRVTLLSYWMRTSPTNARLLSALHSALPLVERIVRALPTQHPERADIALLYQELGSFSTWQVSPPDTTEPPLVRLRLGGPVEVLDCPCWIRLELVGAIRP